MDKVTIDTVKVGMRVRSIYNGTNYSYAAFLGKTGTIASLSISPLWFCNVIIEWDNGDRSCTSWGGDISEYFEEFNGKPRKPRKIIPDIPLDPTLPILQAGHLQDRMRKKF